MSEQTAFISLFSTDLLVFMIYTQPVLREVGNKYVEQTSLMSNYVISFSSNSSQVMKPIDSRRVHKIPALALIRNQTLRSPPYHPIYLKFFLISSSHLCLALPSGFLTRSFPTMFLYLLLLAQIHAIWPGNLIFRLDMPNKIWRGVKIIKFLVLQFRSPSWNLLTLRSDYTHLPQHPVL